MRETAPTTGSIGCTSGYPSANRMMPSDTNKFRPHPRDHIIGMDLQNPSAFLDRFRVFLIRRKHEDEVIGQFAIAGVTSNQPSQFVLLLRDPGFISRIELRKVVVSHVTQFRLREAATTPDGALHTPNNTHKEGVGSSGQYEPRFGMTTSFTRTVRWLHIRFVTFTYRTVPLCRIESFLTDWICRFARAVESMSRSRSAGYSRPISPRSMLCRRRYS